MSETTSRIHIIDIIRGVAVLGIFAINFPDMALPEDLAYEHMLIDPGMGVQYWIGVISDTLFLDKMRALFTLLFGVSSVLIVNNLTRKNTGIDAADIYFRRLTWLLVFGLIHVYILLWAGDVLFEYALLGMLLFSFRKAPVALLASLMLGCLLVLTMNSVSDYRYAAEVHQRVAAANEKQASGQELSVGDRKALEKWQEMVDEIGPDEEDLEDDLEAAWGSYSDKFFFNAEGALSEDVAELARRNFWDMFAYMLLGVMLFRSGFFDSDVKDRTHALIAIFGIGIGLPFNAWIWIQENANVANPADSLYYLMFVQAARLPLVLGYLSSIILIFRRRAAARVGRWLAATGTMALTNYLMQSVIGGFLLYGFGFGLYYELDRVDITIVIAAVWVFQIAFSTLSFRYFKFGPFEWVWRCLTYWQWQSYLRPSLSKAEKMGQGRIG